MSKKEWDDLVRRVGIDRAEEIANNLDKIQKKTLKGIDAIEEMMK